jgi:hypothetical protein
MFGELTQNGGNLHASVVLVLVVAASHLASSSTSSSSLEWSCS